jgi:S-(hydroxymethyl)glutathione dehydrogenase/alcohol dehydrogenase
MPDGTSRFSTTDGTEIAHFMGCSTFSEYTVVPEIALAKIRDDAPLDTGSLLGCGVTTGLGAVWNNCDVEGGSSVAVFGLGAVGLAVIQGAQMRGAKQIYAIDVNKRKFDIAKELGATHVVCPTDFDKPIQEVLVEMSPTGFGIDYTFGEPLWSVY